MMYVITRLGRKLHTRAEVSAVQGHNSREQLVPNAVDNEARRPRQLIGSSDLWSDISTRLPEKRRKNAVLAAELLYSASPEYFRPEAPEAVGTWNNDLLDAWLQKTLNYLREKWGDRMVSATLHLDESTPHLHVVVVPIDIRGRLNGRDVFNQAALRDNQTAYALALTDLGLQRGIEGSRAQHEPIKKYYARVNSALPTISPLLPNVPAPSGKERIMESLGLETEHSRAVADSKEARRKRTAEQKALFQAALSKAADRDAMKKRLDVMTKNLNTLKAEAAQARDIPLTLVLPRLGATPDPSDKNNWRTPAGRITVASDGRKFYNHDLQKGGGGAIDLVMHVDGRNYQDAVRFLSTAIDPTTALGAVAAHARQEALSKILTSPAASVAPPAAPANWPRVRKYLVETRALNGLMVDQLHVKGLVYADQSRNAIFINESGGCQIRGTYGTAFHGQRGKKSPFVLREKDDAPKQAALVESAIDAMSLRGLGFRGRILSFGGQATNLIAETAQALHEQEYEVISAFDNDPAGDGMAGTVEAALLGLCTVKRMRPTLKDWNADLIARSATLDSYAAKPIMPANSTTIESSQIQPN